MTQTITRTETYTASDIKNVFEHIASDVTMICRSTERWSDEHRDNVLHDMRLWIEANFVFKINVILSYFNGNLCRAHEYVVSESAAGWTNTTPQGNIWPKIEGSTLTLILHWSENWKALGDARQQLFREKLALKWSPSSIDTSYAGLNPSAERRYASNAYGVERRSFRSPQK